MSRTRTKRRSGNGTGLTERERWVCFVVNMVLKYGSAVVPPVHLDASRSALRYELGIETRFKKKGRQSYKITRTRTHP